MGKDKKKERKKELEHVTESEEDLKKKSRLNSLLSKMDEFAPSNEVTVFSEEAKEEYQKKLEERKELLEIEKSDKISKAKSDREKHKEAVSFIKDKGIKSKHQRKEIADIDEEIISSTNAPMKDDLMKKIEDTMITETTSEKKEKE